MDLEEVIENDDLSTETKKMARPKRNEKRIQNQLRRMST